jgi:hypothetical protein
LHANFEMVQSLSRLHRRALSPGGAADEVPAAPGSLATAGMPFHVEDEGWRDSFEIS